MELVQRLVQQHQCDLRVKSMNSWTPLHYAAAYNQVPAALSPPSVFAAPRPRPAAVPAASLQPSLLLWPPSCAARPAAVLPARPTCWRPATLRAAPQVAAIQALVSLGCEVVVQDAVGSTPIHVAAGEGHLEAIQELVRLGCSSQGEPPTAWGGAPAAGSGQGAGEEPGQAA